MECDMTLRRRRECGQPAWRASPCLALLLLGSLAHVVAISKAEDMAVSSFECDALSALHGKLQFKNRVKFMKYNFPINYTIGVPHILVFRKNNVTRLLQQNVTMDSLRALWRIVNEKVLNHIQTVLTPLKHPSWNYTAELLSVLDAVAKSRNPLKEPSKIFIEKWIQVKRSDSLTLLKPVRPKALIDNCYKIYIVLHKDKWLYSSSMK